MNPVRPFWYYTYVLMSDKTGTFYTGATQNLKKRLEDHYNEKVYHTRNKLPVKLVYCEACLNKEDAFRRECYLKSGMGKRYLKNRLRKGLTG